KLLDRPNVKLHLYGKRKARPGRKMGHFNVLSANIDDALKLAEDLKQQLSKAD
ncbi:MAG: 5-(carboxyamino)imidazole ribonucleotide synthase, partial [Gammaproteobacteria bacterium]|nr:5-(carboxyamino)imidazole ribonucleotide synthase [Gammaproteobacteria bacterium]